VTRRFRLALGLLGVMGVALPQLGTAQQKIQIAPWGVDPAGQQPPQKSIVVPYRTGEHIVDRVPPGTQSVVIALAGDDPMLLPMPEGMEELEYLTRQFDVAAVVRVTRMQGELTPASDWVFTNVDAQVLDVLKEGPGLTEGQNSITFRASGGTVVRNGMRISTLANSDEIQPGRTYLLFLWADASGTLRTSPEGEFEIVGSKIRRLAGDRRGELLDGDKSERLASVRAKRLSPRVWPKGDAR